VTLLAGRKARPMFADGAMQSPTVAALTDSGDSFPVVRNERELSAIGQIKACWHSINIMGGI